MHAVTHCYTLLHHQPALDPTQPTSVRPRVDPARPDPRRRRGDPTRPAVHGRGSKSLAHAACPPAFRAAMRAAACSLRTAGLPPELLQVVVCHAAEAQLWPGSSRGVHTPPPTSLAELERR